MRRLAAGRTRRIELATAWLTLAACAGLRAEGPAWVEFVLADEVNWRAGKTVVGAAREMYAYDSEQDTVSVTVKFDRRGFAPLPPMLALALDFGFPIEINRPVQDTGQSSVFGPLKGVAEADGYTWRLKGLSRYVFPGREIGRGMVPTELQEELETELAKVLEAGHLRPWLTDFKKPCGGVETPRKPYFFWTHPADALYVLAEAMPLLPQAMQQRLKAYLQKERENFPPEHIACLPVNEGTPREYFVPPGSVYESILRTKASSSYLKLKDIPPDAWSVYGLARYYEACGHRPEAEVMEDCHAIIGRLTENSDWATLYWRKGHQPHKNAVQGVNRVFAGLVGYIRLCRLAGAREAEALGWGMLARTAVLRFAMGKYAQYEQKTGRFTLPADPAWWAKLRAGSWNMHLITWNWARPVDNVRQMYYLCEDGVATWEWMGVGGADKPISDFLKDDSKAVHSQWVPVLLCFADITPELGAFLRDHLKLEVEAYCRRVVENQPHWYIAYPEQIVGREQGRSNPLNAYWHFMARVWVLGEPAAQLEHYLDVPELPRLGDFFYLHKLAETIRAYRGVTSVAP